MPPGQTPHTVLLHAHHDLVDSVQPGDRYGSSIVYYLCMYMTCIFFLRITVTGIYRATPLRVNPRARTVKAVYKTYIDVIHFRKTDKKRLRERDDEEDEEGYIQYTNIVYIYTVHTCTCTFERQCGSHLHLCTCTCNNDSIIDIDILNKIKTFYPSRRCNPREGYNSCLVTM